MGDHRGVKEQGDTSLLELDCSFTDAMELDSSMINSLLGVLTNDDNGLAYYDDTSHDDYQVPDMEEKHLEEEKQLEEKHMEKETHLDEKEKHSEETQLEEEKGKHFEEEKQLEEKEKHSEEETHLEEEKDKH